MIALTAVAIMSVMLAEFHGSTGTAYAVANAERDTLQAEYLAKSGLNLTRMLVGQEPAIRAAAAPLYRMLLGKQPPQLPVWNLANDILRPFCNPSRASAFSTVEGLGDLPGNGDCEIVSFAENSKINVNDPLNLDGNRARRSIAMQLFAAIGGYQSPSPFDPIFENRDPDGQFTTRLDVVASLIDWWDEDTDRTVFDPGAGEISSVGSEDDLYQRLDDPYRAKNAPYDSLEELRLVRGFGDDFWSTFVEPNPDDPQSRLITIYGSGSVNPNEAPPEVLLARVCSFLVDQQICVNPVEASKFIQLVRTVRAMIPVPFFTNSNDFLNFIQGRGGAQDLYPMLRAFLGEDSGLLFVPATIPPNLRVEMDNSFVTAARILSIFVTGRAGCSTPDASDEDAEPKSCRTSVRMNTVVNFHDRWQPAPPNPGRMPPLGIFHYYRVE